MVASLEAARDKNCPIILQLSQGGAAYFAGKVRTARCQCIYIVYLQILIFCFVLSYRASPMVSRKLLLLVALRQPTTFAASLRPTASQSSFTPTTVPKSCYRGWMASWMRMNATSRSTVNRCFPATWSICPKSLLSGTLRQPPNTSSAQLRWSSGWKW